MLGTIVNTAAILIGSAVGACLKKGIGEKHQNALYNAMGLAACGLGIHAIVQNMPNSHFPVMFIISLAAGSLIGSMLSLHEKFEKLTASFTIGNIGPGLSTAILLFCVGTLSILGPMESALHGDNTYLYTNATLDFVTSLVLASTYGIGIALSAVLLFLWQGGIYLFSGYLSSFSAELLTEISLVGGFLIFSSGLSILKIKDCKALNMLPSLFVPILWFLIKTVI
ncbi:DUF554 domain-containing protein [Paenibacillus macerans]|uniref:DUF554 domain-containing protein n=1 Tax=Paenibacillus TaxID=44249 RepID=UPI000ED03FC2|nr:DUF554 domain-containing protein [Paenibacillus macerans]MBS5914306.1 DUF554 domain-containing protein [Paenibacillus macerans]MEC0137793.1 DUF554 domain-containing protein [Paenibacillus macerans]GBK60242.1 DUF554 domain-containing protein [Paenibacillus macerans]GBK66539.1 DUF554 domain-containing protein [Paenibacillus macerans]